MKCRYRFHLLLSILVVCLSAASYAQPDSLHLKRYEKVIYRDTSIIVQRDVTIPNSPAILKVKKRRLVRFYYDYMFVSPKEINSVNVSTPVSYSGKTVGNIYIKKLEPFGKSITDTTRNLKDWLIDAGNTLHILTRDRVILNHLLFKQGEELNRNSLPESERLLRRLPFILDAQVYAVQSKTDADAVDVYVVTQDVFSIVPYIEPQGINAINLGIEETNMFGLGQSFYNNFIFNTTKKVGYEGRYSVYNLYGTFMQGDIRVAFTEDSLLVGLSNTREFISPEIRNAGGFSYHYRILRYYSRFDTNRERTNVSDNNADAWYGRSFPVTPRDYNYLGKLNLIAAVRSSSTWFHKRPEVSADTNLAFQRNTLLLGSFGLSRSSFAKDILIAGFGVIEDVPIGILADITGGYSIGEFVSRPYMGALVSHGTFSRAGYFFTHAELGSYFRGKHPEDGALRASCLYVSKLFARKRLFKGRLLFQTQYLRGINRTNDDDRIDLQDFAAIRGLGTNQLFANTAFASGATLSLFSPWYVLGFRLAFFALTDLTYFAPQDELVFSSRPYWGFSTGFRLNNQNFILGTIDFNISFYPSPPPGASAFSFGLHINPIFPFPDFNGKKPGPITYGRNNKLYY